MPEAIATTKRKFHKLLDTLTSYANAPPAPTTPLTAREKLDLASERVRKRQKQDGSLSSIESRLRPSSTTSLHHKIAARKTEEKEQKELPNFSPWSQERFLQRLQTFSKVSTWHPKPERIDEVAWAKRGWSCVDVNTVGCVGGCNRRVVIQIKATATDEEESEEEEALEEALAARYENEIIEGHSESCLWKKSGCKDDIYRIQVVRPAVWQPALKDRYSSLLTISSSIRDIQIHARDLDIPTTRLLSELAIEVLPTSELSDSIQEKALEIAMLGWQGCSELGADLLRCDACFQRIGLWMYQPGYRARSTFDEEDARLDLATMHREYCPWRSAKSQMATGSLADLSASAILVKVVATYVREKRRRTEENAVSDQENVPEPIVDIPKLSKEEIERADRERESRLQKLKRMLSIRRPVRV